MPQRPAINDCRFAIWPLFRQPIAGRGHSTGASKHRQEVGKVASVSPWTRCIGGDRSGEHTSEIQSQANLVCRLLLLKKKNNTVIALSRIVMNSPWPVVCRSVLLLMH